jgi:hypothetical protein
LTAQQSRALYRFVEIFLATGILTTAYQYLTRPEIDWKALGASVLAALVAAGVQWLKDADPNANSPTVESVNRTLQTALVNPLVSVSPPKATLPPQPKIVHVDPLEEHHL